MCGIAGIFFLDECRPVAAHSLQRMATTLAHRGPDGFGYHIEASVGMAHRRLSIIDVDGGRQPLGNEDGTVQAVFNGEIYNFVDLRNELQARGHKFRTRTDTEVLVHLYEEMGERLVERLRGMFAFAIWDARRRRLLLARDRIGIKPLYVYRDAEKLLFGSELKAILAADDIDRSIDPTAVEDYLAYGFVPGEKSIFARIKKLPPAHTLCVSAEDWNAQPRRYWDLPHRTLTRATVADWTDAIRDKLEETVRVHRLADVEVGALLSGGIDSTVITSVLARQVTSPVRTFSIGFNDRRFDESPVARRTAERLGCMHQDEIESLDAAPDLDEFVRIYDEPFADSSAIPMLRLSRLAARHVKVVLSGDGGDEAFGGYRRYVHDLREETWRRRIPDVVRRILRPVAAIWPKADWAPRPLRMKTLLSNLALETPEAYANTLALCRNPWRRRLCAPLTDSLRSHRPEQRIAEAFVGDDSLSGMIGVDIRYLLPDDFLTKVERASMAFGLEVRPPLVDHELLELAWQTPSYLKINGGETKWILKRAFADMLPEDVARRPKQGFEVPIDAWLRGPLREQFESSVLASNSRIGHLIHQGTASQLFHRHLRGVGRHGPTLWSLTVLAAWCERYLAVPTPAAGRSEVQLPQIASVHEGING